MPKIILENNLVSVNWLHSRLKAENLVVLDATIGKIMNLESPTSLQIPNARFFDIKKKFSNTEAQFPNTFPSEAQFEAEAIALGINKDSAIIVYDDKGIYSSARAWWLFKCFGHNNVAVLDGGLPDWVAKGYEVNHKHSKNTIKGNFIAKIKPEGIINIETLQTIIDDKSRTIIDARSAERFNGEVPEPRAGLRSGTISQSINIPFLELIENSKLKPVDELQAIFAKIGSKEQELVFSCGSGITACILALGATLANYKKISIYDGSWTEYGTLIKA